MSLSTNTPKTTEIASVMGAQGALTMSSREIAELTGKEHDNVRRDIKNMAKQLSLNFEEKIEPSTGGRPSKAYLLPKRETLILVSGYSVELRARIVDRWMELEAQQHPKKPLTINQKRLIIRDVHERLGAATAQKAAVQLGYYEDLGMPELAVVRPGQKELGMKQPDQPRLELREGLGFLVTGGKVVVYDTTDHQVSDDGALVVCVVPEPAGSAPRMEKVNAAIPERRLYGARTALLWEASPAAGCHSYSFVNVLGRVVSTHELEQGRGIAAELLISPAGPVAEGLFAAL
jgi:phage regulator Rha-like protein